MTSEQRERKNAADRARRARLRAASPEAVRAAERDRKHRQMLDPGARGRKNARERDRKARLRAEARQSAGQADPAPPAPPAGLAGPPSAPRAALDQAPGARRGGRYLLPDDGLLDEVAVRLAVSGARVVRLTAAERAAAVREMVACGLDSGEIAEHLGTSSRKVAELLRALGYRLTGSGHGYRAIVPAEPARNTSRPGWAA